MPIHVVMQEVVFLALAAALLAWAQWRLPKPSAAFPGPRPVGAIFKAWLIVIWLVGLLLPLVALVFDGWVGGRIDTRVALLPYFAMFFLQVAAELFVWKRWLSPVWVLVPCVFLPWRVYQISRGLELLQDPTPALTLVTLYALFVLWVINIGVHYSNIPATLRWDYHPPDRAFPSLRDPRVFVADAQDGPAEKHANS